MGRSNQTRVRVDLAMNVSMPSPTVAFGALQSGNTCTVLECLLSLQSAGKPDTTHQASPELPCRCTRKRKVNMYEVAAICDVVEFMCCCDA